MLVEQTTCKSGAPTQDGSKYSSMKRANSSTGLTAKFLMSHHPKMKKDKLLVLQVIPVRTTRNGEFFILTKLLRLKQRDSMKSSASTSIDHSTSDPDCQCKELLNVTELTTSGSRDGERMLLLNSGTSMRSQRQSRTTTGSLTHLTSNPMEDQATSDALELTQDGGRCSDSRDNMSPTRKVRFLKLLEELILKNRNIGVNNRNNKIHQQWDIVYVDEWQGEPTKGQLNKRFGLYVERDFYVISGL